MAPSVARLTLESEDGPMRFDANFLVRWAIPALLSSLAIAGCSSSR